MFSKLISEEIPYQTSKVHGWLVDTLDEAIYEGEYTVLEAMLFRFPEGLSDFDGKMGIVFSTLLDAQKYIQKIEQERKESQERVEYAKKLYQDALKSDDFTAN